MTTRDNIIRYYEINSYWGPRRETPQTCAARLSRMFEELSHIDPVFGNWLCFSQMKLVPRASLSLDGLAALIQRGVDRAEVTDRPTPQYGYRFGALNSAKKNPRSISLSVHAGRELPGNFLINSASIRTAPLDDENASFINLRVFKLALLALASAWDVTWCSAYPWSLVRLKTKPEPPRPWFSLAWMTYISPRFAPMITPPRSAISDWLPNGALLMIATEERFETENPAHLAVARDIEAALAPVNALPWPPDATPET
jgi:immunity protein 52 of polymorphic toxin system